MESDRVPRRAKPSVVLLSLESEDGLRCVDLFRRQDGTFGYGEFRRDPEDQGSWTPVNFASALIYASLDEARAAAGAAIVWIPQGNAAEPAAR